MKGCLGLLNTEHYAYGDLFNEMNLVTGGMVPPAGALPDVLRRGLGKAAEQDGLRDRTDRDLDPVAALDRILGAEQAG